MKKAFNIIVGLLCTILLGYSIYLNFVIFQLKNNSVVIEEKQKEDSYNYLAIGNSITLHGKCDYWWNEQSGMAASKPENDYVHLVKNYLEREHEKVSVVACNMYTWEIQDYDRAESLTLFDDYLKDNLNLISVQLSENVQNIDTFESDYRELIKYIQNKSPNARIIIIDDFWDESKSMLIKEAVKDCNVEFVDLSEIRGKEEYTCGIGTIVYDEQGKPHTVEHNGVAEHPGDKGMKYIADSIIFFLKED